jgi:hypothetical protein
MKSSRDMDIVPMVYVDDDLTKQVPQCVPPPSPAIENLNSSPSSLVLPPQRVGHHLVITTPFIP